MNIKHKPLEVFCDSCGLKYEIPYTRIGDKARAGFVMAFAICGRCGIPRNKETHEKHKLERKCSRCHVPQSLQKLYSLGLCKACYLNNYRNMKQKYDKNGNIILPCELCSENIWKTKEKEVAYECRSCGNIRTKEVSQKSPASVS